MRALWGLKNVAATVAWRSAADAEWHMPDLAVAPRTTSEVVEVMKQVSKDQMPVIPVGGGTGYSGGVTSRTGGLLIETRRMTDVLNIDPKMRLVRVQVGINIVDLTTTWLRLGFGGRTILGAVQWRQWAGRFPSVESEAFSPGMERLRTWYME
jgi:FAD/FMN-containing dehydrogenase